MLETEGSKSHDSTSANTTNFDMSDIELFENKTIRSVWNKEEENWYFVVADVVEALTDTPNPGDYVKKMRKRDDALSQGWGQIVTPLSVETAGGRS